MRIVDDIGQFYANPDYPTLLLPPENLLLYALVVTLRPRRVLEIGTYRGGSANVIVKALDEVARLAPLIATWQDALGGEGDNHQVADSAAESCLICVDPQPDIQVDWSALTHRATLLRASSPVDLCFIDGDHRYQAVLADTFGVLPYVRPGGYLLFHDAFHPEVQSAIDEAVTSVAGLADCGQIARFRLIDFQGTTGPVNTPWNGLRLVRVGSRYRFRTRRRLIRTAAAWADATKRRLRRWAGVARRRLRGRPDQSVDAVRPGS